MSFYGSVINYLGNFLELAELVNINDKGEIGTFLHLKFKTSGQEKQDVYIDVKDLNEFEAIANSDTINMNIEEGALSASLRNGSITKEHLSENLIRVENGVLIIE